MAATQDFLTTAYLITRKVTSACSPSCAHQTSEHLHVQDVFYDRTQFCQIASYLNGGMEHIELPPPTILKVLLHYHAMSRELITLAP